MSREYLENIKSENRLERIRLIQTSDPVIGGQPTDNEDEFTSNTPLLDLACTMKFAFDEIEKNKSGVETDLTEIKETLNTKAEKNEVEKSLQLKANKTDVERDLKLKADQSTMIDELAKKTDKTAITHETGSSKDKIASQFLVSEIQKAMEQALRQAIPVGFIANWPGETAPNEDWLIMRGQKYSKDQYQELYSLLKTDTLPDGRGVMLRGLDAGRGFDPGRTLLSYQEDAMQKITGHFYLGADDGTGAHIGKTFSTNGAFRALTYGYGEIHELSWRRVAGSTDYGVALNSSLVSRTNSQNETVSKNLSINIIIKVK